MAYYNYFTSISILFIYVSKFVVVTNRYHPISSITDYNQSFVGPPNVFVIGAAKCGTTSLSDLLTDTLQLFDKTHYFQGKSILDTVKEPEFFCDPYFTDVNFKKYIRGFKGDKAAFDGSVCYFAGGASIARRIYQLYDPSDLKKKKFVITLRDPVAMILSGYHHIYHMCEKRVRTDRCNPNVAQGESYHDSFHDFLVREASLKNATEIDVLLKEWLEYIPREQIFIINFESLSGKYLNTVCILITVIGCVGLDEVDAQINAINGLLYFLDHPPIYSRNPLFPHSNSKINHLRGQSIIDYSY
jgi:hypothetical protein